MAEDFEDKRREIGRQAIKAFAFKPGRSGNPGGLDKVYFECRQAMRLRSPELIDAMVTIPLDEREDGAGACVLRLRSARPRWLRGGRLRDLSGADAS